ncbi:MAG: PucR family transcriptional regulator [Lysobacterales bacterium]
MNEPSFAQLTAVLGRLGRSGAAAQLVPALKRDCQRLKVDLVAAVVAEIDAFSASRNPSVSGELVIHCADHVDTMVGLVETGQVGDFAFVAANARRRAEQHFPLEAVLHAYRCGQRVFTRSFRSAIQEEKLRGPALEAVMDLTIEYTDAISNVCTNAYVRQIRLNAELESDRRGQLMDMVLHGFDESDGRAARVLGDAGFLDRRRAFCVIVSRSVDPAEMLNPSRARRLAKSLEEIFQADNTHCLVDVRDTVVVAVISAVHRLSGWTAPNTSLSARAKLRLSGLGNSVLVGLSDDLHHTAKISSGFRQAKVALECAGVDRRVVHIASLSLREMALHYARDELRPVLPDWVEAFARVDQASGQVLGDTLKAYADANMNVLKAAARLSVHANTIYSRLAKVKSASGLEPRSFHYLNELLIACDIS